MVKVRFKGIKFARLRCERYFGRDGIAFFFLGSNLLEFLLLCVKVSHIG
jgi:hypothetical protein